MKRAAFVFGLVFVLAGLAGFVPALCPGGRLFGLFATNEPHDLFYIGTGVLGLVMSLGTQGFARKYFRIVAIAYGLLGLMGFLEGGRQLLLGMAINKADNVLDLFIALVAFLLGVLWPSGDEGHALA